MAIVYLGLGSNLGDRQRNIDQALRLLSSNRVKILKKSSLIETHPIGGPANQRLFLNGAVKVQSDLSPQKLLQLTQSIERKLKRKKTVRNGPRTIDIDILLYDDIKLKTPTLTIPHPRMKKREFVLKPLNEIAPKEAKDLNMKTFRSINSLQKQIQKYKLQKKSIGFVPTMGALHKGHLSLVQKSRRENDITIVSIFVNPKQFGPAEDLSKYPRPEKQDKLLLNSNGIDILFYPTEKMLYPKGFLTYIKTEQLPDVLCGKTRPGHFQGVTTIVGKLLNIVHPDTLYLGQKDAQQAVILEKMIQDLNFPVKVKTCPIIRETDGLALSSRNIYLSDNHRREAPVLYKALHQAQFQITRGERNWTKIKKSIQQLITKESSAKIEYVQCVDIKTLKPVPKLRGKIMIALAVKFASTRLIDNIFVTVK